MKKIFFLTAVLFALLTGGIAQNTSPYWSLAGNSNATSSSKLGTSKNISLRFYTNNVQRMIINSAAGFVGIGTASPENTLHVFKGSAGAVTGYVNAPLIVENSTSSYINILAPDIDETGILFG